MGRATDYLSVVQFDLLQWVAAGCKEGVYEGGGHRVSARALHNRGFVRVSGSGATWAVEITPDGTRRLKEEATRIEAERQRARREEEARAERQRKEQELTDRAVKLLHDVIAAGGRLDLGPGTDSYEIHQLQTRLGQSALLPEGQRLAQEPTRMDPVFGVTVYLEPGFTVTTAVRTFDVPRQLRDPHAAVVEFQDKKALVSKAQIGRAARFLQALIAAVIEVGWKIPTKGQKYSYRQGDPVPDFSIQLPSRELVVTMHELDERGRRGQAYVTETDYYLRTTRTTVNKHFQASGRLEVSLTKRWENETVLSIKDAAGAPLEAQLPLLIHKLEVAEAEAKWAHQEEARRAEIRQTRWEEVKKEALTKLTYKRNAELLQDQLERRQSVALMRAYANEIDSRADQLSDPEKADARAWADWIRQHADVTDPINGKLRVVQISNASATNLEPYMNGWSSYGPHRQ